MTMELADFIAARLDEDEEAARDLLRGHPGPWRVGLPSEVRDSAGAVVVADEYHWDPMPHIARHDPARALREVTAKRAIVADWQAAIAATPHEDDQVEYSGGYAMGRIAALEQAARHIAAIDSDHPDYRAEWAPGHG